MILRLGEIPHEGLNVEFKLDPDSPEAKSILAAGPITAALRVDRIGSQLLVKGSVAGSVRLQCSRCLEDIFRSVAEEVLVELRPLSTERRGDDMELASDDLNVEYFDGDALDLGHLVEEQIRLSLPMKPLCSEKCQGLCPRCGRVADGGECTCGGENIDPRWNALAGLRKKDD